MGKHGMRNGEPRTSLAERLGTGTEPPSAEPTELAYSLWVTEESAERGPEPGPPFGEPVSSLPAPGPAASLREGLTTAEERAHGIAEDLARMHSELRLALDAGLAEAAQARSFPRVAVPRVSRRLAAALLLVLAVAVPWKAGLLWTGKVENVVLDSGFGRTSVRWYPAGHQTELSRVAGQGRGGSAALEVHTYGPTDGEGPGYVDVSGIQQGRTHSLSVYARSLGGATVYAEIRWKASDGSFIEASRGAPHRLGASWQRVVASGVAPRRAASALLVVGEDAGTPGRVGYLIDDAQFEQASDPGTYVATDGRTGVLPAHPTDVAALLMLAAAVLFALTTLRLVVLVAIPLSLLVPPSITTVGSPLPDMTPTRALVLASFCVLLARRQLRFPPRRVTVPAIAYVAAVGVAVVLQPSVHAGGQALAVTLGAWAPALLVLGVTRRPRDLWLLCGVLSGAATVAAGLALVEVATGQYLLGEEPGLIFRVLERSGTLRTQATFPHPILLGTFVALALPLVVALAVRRGGWSRVGWLVAFLLVVAGLSSTLSRGPWLAAAAALTVFLVLSGLRRRWIYLAAALAALGLAAALPVATPVRDAAAGVVTRSDWQDRYIVDFRLQQADALARYAVANPFSAQLDAASRPHLPGVVEGREIDNAAQLDSIYGNELMQTGVFGLLAYLATVVIAIAVVFRSSRRAWGELRVLGSALFAACTVALVVGLFSNVLGFAQVGAAFWLAIGAGICLGSLTQGGAEGAEVTDAGWE
jgi:hypothetical protein